MPSIRLRYAVTLGLIIILGLIISIKTVLGPGFFIDFWDDPYYVFFSHYIANYGFHNIEVANFASEYILVGIPAILYKLFGISLFTEGLFSMFCLVGSIISVFFIGKILRNELAGIFSALTFIFVPIVAAEGAASGDNMAMAFFSTLAVLLLLIGISKKKQAYYALSGFIGMLGVQAGSALNLIIFVFLVPYLFYLLLKDRSKMQRTSTLLFFVGIALAVALIILLSYVLQSSPFIYFQTNYIHGPYPTSSTPVLLPYLTILFPMYHVPGVGNWFLWPDLIEPAGNSMFINVIGFFGYAMLISLIYLIAKRQHSVLLPLAWFVMLLLYLSFGIDSLSGGYILFVERFTIVLAPSMAIIIGLAIENIYEGAFPRKRKEHRKAKKHLAYKVALSIVILAYIIMLANSLLIANFIHEANYALTYQWAQVANVLLTLPKNASIYISSGMSQSPGPGANGSSIPAIFNNISSYIFNSNFLQWIGIEAYGHYGINASFSEVFRNCSTIEGDYIVVANDTSYKNNLPLCNNVDLYFTPQLNASLANVAKVVGSRAQLSVYKVAP